MDEYVKYSVIIPVYNAESTIKRCLDSLLSQIPVSAELLIINDGSEDQSGEICKEYEGKYQAIRYFEKANGGVSTARNLGLDYAKGEYILFVDSDDYVASEYWQTIDSLLNKHQPDMLQFGFRECGKTVNTIHTGNYTVNGEIPVAEKVDKAIRAYMFSTLCARTYKRKLVQKYGLRFNPNLAIGEDQAFIFSYAVHMRSLVSTSNALYNAILENEESLSRKRRDYLVNQLLEVNNDMFAVLEKASLSSEVKQIYRGSVAWVYYRSAYSACKELLKYDLSNRERRNRIREICKLYSVSQIKPCDLKCKIIAFPVMHRMCRVIDVLICRA